MRTLTFTQAIHEAFDVCLRADPSVFVIGEGVPDPKGIFGTTLKLQEKYGRKRVLDMPLSENGITGVCIGAALSGMKPVIIHQRIDFSVLALDQVVNVAAKWHAMFGAKLCVPIVIRVIIGRGWGQGAQHSQSLQAMYAHFPGLKVVMPTTPSDAKGLLIAAIYDGNPVVYIEHRWLHHIKGKVQDGFYKTPIGKGRIVQKGKDVTIVASSYMVVEAIRAAGAWASEGVSVEVVDVRSIKPLDTKLILQSVGKTGRVVVADTGYSFIGFAGEVIATVCERAFASLKSAPQRVATPDIPTPTSWALAKSYYPTAIEICEAIAESLKVDTKKSKRVRGKLAKDYARLPSDVPDMTFTGPF